MNVAEALRTELESEAAVTRTVLARMPDDKLSWRPHPKSMSLGQLGQHVAALPGAFAEMMQVDELQLPTVPLPEPGATAEVLATLDEGIATAAARITQWGPEGLAREWHMLAGDVTLLRMPRGEVVRKLVLNHSYHHRGQITVYLRLLGVPLPWVYGPTADER